MNSRYQMYIDNDGASIIDEDTGKRAAGPMRWNEATRLVAKMNKPRKRHIHLAVPKLPVSLSTVTDHFPVLVAVGIWLLFILVWMFIGTRAPFWHA